MVHWIEIIGEAARGVNDKVRAAHPEVPWRVITDMRNRVSHGEAGACVESLFPTVLADGDFAPVDLRSADYAQIADLVNTYESIPLGTSDASVVAIADGSG